MIRLSKIRLNAEHERFGFLNSVILRVINIFEFLFRDPEFYSGQFG